jgi:hypothetical protein
MPRVMKVVVRAMASRDTDDMLLVVEAVARDQAASRRP